MGVIGDFSIVFHPPYFSDGGFSVVWKEYNEDWLHRSGRNLSTLRFPEKSRSNIILPQRFVLLAWVWHNFVL